MARPCPHIPGFAYPMMPGLECSEQGGNWTPGSVESKAAFCRSEASRASRSRGAT